MVSYIDFTRVKQSFDFLFIYFSAYMRKIPKEQSMKDIARLPGVELSMLRDLPRRSNFITANNLFYSGGPLTDAEISSLPQIKREQVEI